MEVRNLQTWDDFEYEVEKLTNLKHSVRSRRYRNNLLFRGQSDATWKLETTMERFMGPKQNLMNYYDLIAKVQTRIETFTDKTWELPDRLAYDKWQKEIDPIEGPDELPAIDYMVYLRHHGFPSPLLDWSSSPHVAAYFAFRDTSSKAKSVAIFAYIERSHVKTGSSDKPNIWRSGSNIRSDKRHFLQQSDYTICTVKVHNQTYYANHEKVFSREKNRKDFLWKFTLPSSERFKALEKLDAYNINAYSLLGSEESLMETVFLRENFLT